MSKSYPSLLVRSKGFVSAVVVAAFFIEAQICVIKMKEKQSRIF